MTPYGGGPFGAPHTTMTMLFQLIYTLTNTAELRESVRDLASYVLSIDCFKHLCVLVRSNQPAKIF
jgi:hypothetical protein